MSILEVLHARRAVRNFKEQEVEREKIEQLLEAAILAPNDRLREPWHFYVVSGNAKTRYDQLAREYLEERFPTKPHLVEESLKVLYATPLLIVVTSDLIEGDAASSTDNEYAVCCAVHSMWLRARELGLGMVWRTRGIGLVHDARLHAFIGSPKLQKVVATLFIGYPLQEEKSTKRTPYLEKTTWL